VGISSGEFQRRYAAIREIMDQDGLDRLLVVGLPDDFNRGNIRYITGSGRGGCCIFPRQGRPVFLTGPRQSTSLKLRHTMAALELLELKETDSPPEQAVKELARLDRGGRTGVLGMNCISVAMYLAIKNRFGDGIVDRGDLLWPLRVIKSAEEIEKTRRSAAIADQIYARLREIIRPGLSEYEIYSEVKGLAYRLGCEYSFDLIDASGSTMNMSFYPTPDVMEAGGTLFMEITPAYDGYYAQLPVTLPVGEYKPAVRRMVSAWNKADQATRPLLRPGTKVSEVYRVLVNTVRENGFISPYRPGHSIGLDALDPWSITEDNQTVLATGMVLAVHPSVMLEFGGDACGMGFTYLITPGGAEKLSGIDLAAELLGE
jgi:Xaa-Pro aminopeptidase/Xaa-Pro dipeptidase